MTEQTEGVIGDVVDAVESHVEGEVKAEVVKVEDTVKADVVKVEAAVEKEVAVIKDHNGDLLAKLEVVEDYIHVHIGGTIVKMAHEVAMEFEKALAYLRDKL